MTETDIGLPSAIAALTSLDPQKRINIFRIAQAHCGREQCVLKTEIVEFGAEIQIQPVAFSITDVAAGRSQGAFTA